MTLDERIDQVIELSKKAMKGDHGKVATACDISRNYLYHIRKKIAPLHDVLETRQLLQRIALEYRSIQQKREQEIEEFEKQQA